MSADDAISLTRSLLAYDTINPPGREQDCARRAGALLGEWGFSVAYHDYEPGRTSVVARAGGNDAKAPLCLTGHLDTVALGTRPWSKDPFAGEADGDRLYGRGVSDMKAGVAAILLAARNVAPRLGGTPGIVVVLTDRSTSREPRSLAAPARSWSASRRRTIRTSGTRARSSSTRATRASRRTARCRSSA